MKWGDSQVGVVAFGARFREIFWRQKSFSSVGVVVAFRLFEAFAEVFVEVCGDAARDLSGDVVVVAHDGNWPYIALLRS